MGAGLGGGDGDDEPALGQHQRELAERAGEPVALASQPQLVAVAEQPVGVGLVGGDLRRGRTRHPALGQQPLPLPDAVAAVQLAHRCEIARADVDARPTEAASEGVAIPGRVDAERSQQARTQVVEQVLTGARADEFAEQPGRAVVVHVP